MKTGIITYHNARNYGAVLQTFALQETLKKLNYPCEIIDYRSRHIENIYKVKQVNELKSIKEAIKWGFSIKNQKKSQRKFDLFLNDYLNLSDEIYSDFDIDKTNLIYDSFIVGSDQVWNMNLNGNDDNFLLSFVNENNKKISYAASFGYDEIPNEYTEVSCENIKKFDAISVREEAGKKIVDNIFKGDAEVVLDPTLLMDVENWQKLILERPIKNEYILVYIIASTPSILQLAKELAKKYSCEVICIHNSFRNKKGVKNVRDCSPQEFLSYIYYAKAVIASSYHGICFSLLFNKEFYFELDKKPLNNNSRIVTLANKFDFWEREIINNEINEKHNLDFENINQNLSIQREKSFGFIRKNL